MKKLFCLLLAALMLLPLVACNTKTPEKGTDSQTAAQTDGSAAESGAPTEAAPSDSDKPSDTTPTGSETVTVTDPAETKLVLDIITGGTSKYKICRSEKLKSDDKIVKACQTMMNDIKQATGTLILITDDWVARNQTVPEYEILVGDTDRDETRSVKENLLAGSFAIKAVGKKLVIVGGSDDATIDAVNYFLENYVPKLTEGSFVFTSDDDYIYDHAYRVRSISLLGTPIEQYTIVTPKVYSASEYRLAIQLKTLIANITGKTLTISRDSVTAEHEILIGATARSTDIATGQNFKVSAADGKFMLSGGSMFAYIEMVTYLRNKLFFPSAKDIVIESGFNYTEDVTDTLINGAENVLTRSGDIRVMFNNMYGNCRDEHPRVQRQQQLIELYIQYNPDVLGLQECNPNSRVGTYAIDKQLKLNGYDEVKAEGLGSNSNYTPIFYRTDRVKVIDSGWVLYADGQGDKSKSFTWAIFETLDTKEQFGFVSTHFCYKGDDENGTASRLKDAEQMMAKVTALMATYDVPYICGGDLNCNSSTSPYASIIKGGYVDVALTAEKREDVKSSHSYPTYNTSLEIYDSEVFPTGGHDKSIDHILVKGANKLEVKLYDVVTDLYSLLSTDHCPIYIDFNIK